CWPEASFSFSSRSVTRRMDSIENFGESPSRNEMKRCRKSPLEFLISKRYGSVLFSSTSTELFQFVPLAQFEIAVSSSSVAPSLRRQIFFAPVTCIRSSTNFIDSAPPLLFLKVKWTTGVAPVTLPVSFACSTRRSLRFVKAVKPITGGFVAELLVSPFGG